MATMQASIFWIMVALTPSMILLAVLLMRTEFDGDPKSHLNSSRNNGRGRRLFSGDPSSRGTHGDAGGFKPTSHQTARLRQR
jgi:hypothetical protein